MIEEILEGKLGPQNSFIIYILHYFSITLHQSKAK